MKPSRILLALLLIVCSLHATAQTDYFYYYGSQKIPLYLNEDKVVVSVSKTCNEIIERIHANVQVLVTINDSNGMDIPEIIKKVKEFMRDNDPNSNSLRPYGFIKVDLKNMFTFYVAMNSANYPIALDRGLYFNRWRNIGDYISNTYNFNEE